MRQSLRLVSGLYLKLSLLTIAVGFLLRIVLLFNEQTTDLGFSFGEWLQVFLLGAVNDLCAATIGFVEDRVAEGHVAECRNENSEDDVAPRFAVLGFGDAHREEP